MSNDYIQTCVERALNKTDGGMHIELMAAGRWHESQAGPNPGSRSTEGKPYAVPDDATFDPYTGKLCGTGELSLAKYPPLL